MLQAGLQNYLSSFSLENSLSRKSLRVFFCPYEALCAAELSGVELALCERRARRPRFPHAHAPISDSTSHQPGGEEDAEQAQHKRPPLVEVRGEHRFVHLQARLR